LVNKFANKLLWIQNNYQKLKHSLIVFGSMSHSLGNQVLYDIAVTYEEYKLNRTMALAYYKLFLNACPDTKSSNYRYAQNRVQQINEELFFMGND